MLVISAVIVATVACNGDGSESDEAIPALSTTVTASIASGASSTPPSVVPPITPASTPVPSAACDPIPQSQGPKDALLRDAATRGDVAALRCLLDAGASVLAQDGAGRTALIQAAYANQVEAGRLLIAAGADVNVQDNSRQSAYLIPTADGGLDFLRLTLANGADVHSLDRFNGTGLIRAADRGHVEIVRELLKTDIKIDHVNNLGWTALLEAIMLGDGGPRHTEVVRLLVEAGANVNLADSNGVSPRQHAQRRGYTQMIEILTQAGAR
jgi:uncharacterized protein